MAMITTPTYLDHVFHDYNHLWVVFPQGKGGHGLYVETSRESYEIMISNNLPITGIYAGQPRAKAGIYMCDDTAAPRYIAIPYKKQIMLKELDTITPLEHTEGCSYAKGTILYNFTTKGPLIPFSNRDTLIKSIDFTNRQTCGILQLHRQGSPNHIKRARNLINDKRTQLIAIEQIVTGVYPALRG